MNTPAGQDQLQIDVIKNYADFFDFCHFKLL